VRRSRQRFQPGRLSLGAARRTLTTLLGPPRPPAATGPRPWPGCAQGASTACCGDALYRRLVAAVQALQARAADPERCRIINRHPLLSNPVHLMADKRCGRVAGRVAQRRALTSCVFSTDEPQLPPRPHLARFRPWHRGVVVVGSRALSCGATRRLFRRVGHSGGRRGCSGGEHPSPRRGPAAHAAQRCYVTIFVKALASPRTPSVQASDDAVRV
jgi:hypothetical protein